jgi:hypothetical protein
MCLDDPTTVEGPRAVGRAAVHKASDLSSRSLQDLGRSSTMSWEREEPYSILDWEGRPENTYLFSSCKTFCYGIPGLIKIRP